jgi:Uncharacterised nucleotidyltransferase
MGCSITWRNDHVMYFSLGRSVCILDVSRGKERHERERLHCAEKRACRKVFENAVITPLEKAWVFQQFQYSEVLYRLDKHFAQLGIRYMPIKGAYLIASGLAEKMPYRRMVDIDILLLPADFARASDYFKGLNNVRMVDNYWPFETSFYFQCGHINVFVELHRQLNYPERFTLPAETLFSRTIRSKGLRELPCPEDSLIIFLCHLFVHIAFELCDMAFDEIELLCTQNNFSWEKFQKLSSPTGLGPFFYYILRLFEKRKRLGIQAGVPTMYAVLCARMIGMREYEKMPRFLKRLLLEIPFARKPLSLMMKKCFRF